jgi:predicted nucleic acid-binding Zn ribbon protein
VPWSPLPDPDGPPPTPIGTSVDRVLRGLGAPPSATLRALFDDWPGVVGEAIASASRPLALEGGRLVVAVSDGGWASQLRWMENDLLAKVADRVGEGVVTALEVRVRPR